MNKQIGRKPRGVPRRYSDVRRLVARAGRLERLIVKMSRKLENANNQLCSLSQIENVAQNLRTQLEFDTEKMIRLEYELASERMKTEQLRDFFGVLGLDIEDCVDKEKLLETIASNAEIVEIIKKRMADEHQPEDESVEQSAFDQTIYRSLRVQISSLKCLRSTLEWSNSQLATEKAETLEELETLELACQGLHREQLASRTLVARLNVKCDTLTSERNQFEARLRIVRGRYQDLRAKYDRKLAELKVLRANKDSSSGNSQSSADAKAETQKLKGEFDNLHQENEKLKSNFRKLEKRNQRLRWEIRNLCSTNTPRSSPRLRNRTI